MSAGTRIGAVVAPPCPACACLVGIRLRIAERGLGGVDDEALVDTGFLCGLTFAPAVARGARELCERHARLSRLAGDLAGDLVRDATRSPRPTATTTGTLVS